MKSTAKRIETVKCPLDSSELRQLSDDLARAVRERFRIENDRKSVMAHYTALEKDNTARIANLSLVVTNGYEMRDLECLVYFSKPQPGMKQIIRPDTNEVIRTEPMTEAEKQSAFDFDPNAKPQ